MEKASECNKPVFIGGLMGSGTTMLVKTLDRHKNIAGYDETQLICILEVMDKRLLSPESELHTRYLSRYVSDDMILDSIRLFAGNILKQKPLAEGKRRFAEKSPFNFRYWRLLKKIFPDARLIFIIRDGRDLVSSGLSYKYWKDTGHGAGLWVEAIKKSREEAASFPNDYIEVRYEMLVRETGKSMKEILDFIEEEYDETVMELEKSIKFTRKWGDKASMTNPIGRWQTEPLFDKEAFKNTAGEMLIELGYAADSNW